MTLKDNTKTVTIFNESTLVAICLKQKNGALEILFCSGTVEMSKLKEFLFNNNFIVL